MVPAHLTGRRNNGRWQARTLVVLGGVLPLHLGLVARGVLGWKRGRACSECRWFWLIVLMMLLVVLRGLHVMSGRGAVVRAIPHRRLITHTKKVNIATPMPVSMVMPRCG